MNPEWEDSRDYITLNKYSKNIFAGCFSFSRTKEGYRYWSKLWSEYSKYLKNNLEI